MGERPTHLSLEEILNATLTAASPAGFGLDEDRRRLRSVVRRDPDGINGSGSALADFFAILLSSYFEQKGGDVDRWRPMASRIARTIGEDPVLRLRVQTLWRQLCEEA